MVPVAAVRVRQPLPPAFPSSTRPALRFREIAFSFEPPVPGFECRFLYQVLRALAVIFRQRWEGFQILAGNPQAGSQPARGARKARGKPFQPTVAPRLWADGRPIISPGMSHIYQSNRQLRPYPWSRSPLAATTGRAFTRARNAAPLYPRSLREGGVRQRTFKPQFRTRLTVALRQQPGGWRLRNEQSLLA